MDHDYFGKEAEKYKLNRPQYSLILIQKINEKLEQLGSSGQRMLDIATGSGQLAIALANKFTNVYGLDISEKQIVEASKRQDKPPNVKFEVFDCSQIQKFSELNEIGKYDLITVGQGLHWFEPQKILNEIKSTLKKGTGLLAVLSYNQFDYEAKSERGQQFIDILEKYREKVWPYFQHNPDELNGYPSYPFQDYFGKVEKHIVQIPFDLSLDDMIKFMCTYSAVQNYNQKQNKNFNQEIRSEIAACKLTEEEEAQFAEASYFAKISMKYNLIFAYQ